MGEKHGSMLLFQLRDPRHLFKECRIGSLRAVGPGASRRFSDITCNFEQVAADDQVHVHYTSFLI